MNACFECCDRHALAKPDDPALFYEGEGRSSTVTFRDFQIRALGFANLLTRNGVRAGDCVAALVPRSPELMVIALGVWRVGAVFLPLFTAFGEAAIDHRVRQAEARMLVVDNAYRAKVDGLGDLPPLITISVSESRNGEAGFWSEMAEDLPYVEPAVIDPEAPFLRMFTSGSTGKPKSLDVPLKALSAFGSYMREEIGIEREDRFWNLADPGWAYGLYYGLIGPLLLGYPAIFLREAFDPQLAIQVIQRLGITSLAGSPTAFRLLMAAGSDAVRPIKGQLRSVASAGEPLTPDVNSWFVEHLGVAIRDHYGQTELGIVLTSKKTFGETAAERSGGVACPGYHLVVLDDAGQEVRGEATGELAVDRSKSPSFWFQGYRENANSLDRYYRTGDAVKRDEDGSFTFVGRTDDVITSSGYRIGPFDVESALAEHVDVLEAAVVGKPDPNRTEIVKAFVVLKPGIEATDALAGLLQQHVRQRLSAHAYPREIEFISELPRTPSGKVQRFLLKSR